jgi:glycosyltransferase involved in cell wall biosynthesis
MGAGVGSEGAGGPLRVAIFTNNDLPRLSGVAVAVDFLDRALREAGHATLIVAPDYGEPSADEAPNVRRVRSIRFTPEAALAVPALDSPLRAVRRFRADLVHAQHPFVLGVAARAAARRLGVPLVYTFHTLYEEFLTSRWLRRSRLPALLRAHVERFVRSCDLVVAPSEPIRRVIERRIPEVPRTASLPTGLDPERFRSAAAPDRAARRRELDLPPAEPLLLWAGRLAAEKRPQLAIRTLAELVRGGFRGALAFVGRGGLEPRLERLAREAGVAERVHFCGRFEQSDLPRVLAAGDLFLFTSTSDTQGIVLYEAWAAGLPIVATDSLAARALVDPATNGLRAAADPAALASAVGAVLAAPHRFREPFPWERFAPRPLAARWEEVYRRALALRGAPAAAVPAPKPPAPRPAARALAPTRPRA